MDELDMPSNMRSMALGPVISTRPGWVGSSAAGLRAATAAGPEARNGQWRSGTVMLTRRAQGALIAPGAMAPLSVLTAALGGLALLGVTGLRADAAGTGGGGSC